MGGNPTCAFGLEVGDRIELTYMGPDPDPVPVGSTGTVVGFYESHIPGLGQVWVSWDNGRSLNLAAGVDRWRKVAS